MERAAAPTLSFAARITDPTSIEVYTVALSVMFTIEPGKRSYDADARERLAELFGEPERWASTTGAFRWAQVDVLVPSFTGEAGFEIQVPCTYDHEIAATKYFGGLREGVGPAADPLQRDALLPRPRLQAADDDAALGPLRAP